MLRSALLLLFALTLAPAHAQDRPSGSAEGRASVIDGDTLDIRGQRFRFHGVDAPESSQTCLKDGKAWRCGQNAANVLADKIGVKNVRCQAKDTDRYGRTIAVCYLNDEDLNAWMVSEGWAVAYVQYSRDYVNQERQARASGRGIWGSVFDAPWDYRRAKKGQR